MSGFHIAADVKHPDAMNRNEKLKYIASIECDSEALKWWLTHAPRISRRAFDKARGF